MDMTPVAPRLRKWCVCGALVWDLPASCPLPRYTQSVVCVRCGRDHSRKAPLWWVLWFGYKRLLKRLRFYGPLRMWWQKYPTGLFEYQEKERVRVLTT